MNLLKLRFRNPFYFVADAVVTPELVEPTKGRVVQVTSPPVYDPDQKAHGGRVVRVMPKELKKIKEAQEKAPSEV